MSSLKLPKLASYENWSFSQQLTVSIRLFEFLLLASHIWQFDVQILIRRQLIVVVFVQTSELLFYKKWNVSLLSSVIYSKNARWKTTLISWLIDAQAIRLVWHQWRKLLSPHLCPVSDEIINRTWPSFSLLTSALSGTITEIILEWTGCTMNSAVSKNSPNIFREVLLNPPVTL